MGTGRAPKGSGSRSYVRVSSDWFKDVITYFDGVNGADHIKDMLSDKLDKLVSREGYAKSHNYSSSMSDHVQIDSGLFNSVADYLAEAAYNEHLDSVYKETNDKLAALDRRSKFTDYKTAPTGSDEREQARNDYLDTADILPDFRSSKESSD